MKKYLDNFDPWQTHTYLNTTRDFEKIFDLDVPINDREIFANKIQEFGSKFKAKD